jgi:hypothetical protein
VSRLSKYTWEKKLHTVRVITRRRFFFAGGLFRVFGRDSNNCNFDSSVKSTNVPQKKNWGWRLVMTGTIKYVFLFHQSRIRIKKHDFFEFQILK